MYVGKRDWNATATQISLPRLSVQAQFQCSTVEQRNRRPERKMHGREESQKALRVERKRSRKLEECLKQKRSNKEDKNNRSKESQKATWTDRQIPR